MFIYARIQIILWVFFLLFLSYVTNNTTHKGIQFGHNINGNADRCYIKYHIYKKRGKNEREREKEKVEISIDLCVYIVILYCGIYLTLLFTICFRFYFLYLVCFLLLTEERKKKKNIEKRESNIKSRMPKHCN